MNPPGAQPDQLVAARRALLDALGALQPHLDALVLIGAQAIYLHTGAANVTLAETTKDSDLALDTRALPDTPLLEHAMQQAGFRLDPDSPQPGSWLSRDYIPVDLLVPAALAGPGGRRGARIPPHSKRAARRANGIEAAIVDHNPMRVGSLDPHDQRAFTVRVASPGVYDQSHARGSQVRPAAGPRIAGSANAMTAERTSSNRSGRRSSSRCLRRHAAHLC